jgi:hypothetical protein
MISIVSGSFIPSSSTSSSVTPNLWILTGEHLRWKQEKLMDCVEVSADVTESVDGPCWPAQTAFLVINHWLLDFACLWAILYVMRPPEWRGGCSIVRF